MKTRFKPLKEVYQKQGKITLYDIKKKRSPN